MQNPFNLIGYTGPSYFCDREEETKNILDAIESQRNLTLYAIRRLGKTGLTMHVFHNLPKKEFIPVYIDAMATQSGPDFINKLVRAVTAALTKENKSQAFLKRILEFFGRLRPSIAFDPLTGLPTVELDLQSSREVAQSLESVFHLLGEEKKTPVLAIDEFQQVRTYPDAQIESLLRSQMQANPDVRFIFSGSQRHLLLGMFSDTNSPLYRSTQLMQLGKIAAQPYARFINKHFSKAGTKPGEGVVEEILHWTRLHTYYTQFVCNRLYGMRMTGISLQDLNKLKNAILEENKPVFYQFRNLLPQRQWELLRAIARENGVTQPMAKDFLFKHNLGAQSTVQAALEGLLTKDMVYENYEESEPRYEVYDVFLSRWLEAKA